MALGVVAAMTVDDELAERSYADFDEALKRAGAHLGWQVWVLFVRATIDLSLGRIEDARVSLEEAMRLGGNPDMAGGLGVYLAIVAHVMGDDVAAAEAMDEARLVMDRMVGLARLRAGEVPERYPRGFAAPGAAIGAATEGTESSWSLLRGYRPFALRSGLPADEADLILACAILWFYDGDHPRAARLLSWVRAHTVGAGAVPTPGDYVLYLHYRDKLRESLGPDEARKAREEGGRLTLEEALDLAFAEKVSA
jgi:hypothetical protein